MSGRRRRDDGWDDDRLGSQDDQRDIWADDSVGEWGGRDADVADGSGRSRQPSGGAGGTGAYGRGGGGGGSAYPAPDGPTFQAAGGPPGGGRGSRDGGGQRTAAGYASGAYSPDGGYGGRDSGYGVGAQGGGYGRGGGADGPGGAGGRGGGADGRGGGAGRRDAAGYDSGYGGGRGGPGGPGGGANGYNGRSSANGGSPNGSGRGGAPAAYMPVEDDDMDDDSSSGMPRPYGRLSIYTLREDKTREFDQIAERAAEGVRTSEPDTLVYVIHVVPKAPQQRIIYEIYRDRTAFMSHERQPHIRQFAAERASCVLATNIIDLRLKYAKVAALGGPSDAGAQPQGQSGRGQRQEAPTQAPQYTPSGQYPTARPQGQGASFTPAGGGGGRQGYSQPPPGQYGNSGTGAYGAGNGQYDAANSNGYSGGAGYSNGGSYPSSGYPGANGYSGDNGYPDANGYQGANGADGANGYQGANGYPNGANGYGASNGYSNDGSAGAAGYGESGAGSHSAAPSTQYTPRYRELTSGTSTDLGSAGYGPEWDQGQQGYRQ